MREPRQRVSHEHEVLNGALANSTGVHFMRLPISTLSIREGGSAQSSWQAAFNAHKSSIVIHVQPKCVVVSTCRWLNEELVLKKRVLNLERDFRDGYLLGEILYIHNHQQNFHSFQVRKAVIDVRRYARKGVLRAKL